MLSILYALMMTGSSSGNKFLTNTTVQIVISNIVIIHLQMSIVLGWAWHVRISPFSDFTVSQTFDS